MRNLTKPFIIICTLYLIIFAPSKGQDLSNIGKSKPLTIDGSIGATQVYFDSNRPSSYRKPYSYTLTANLNIAVFGWSIPLSGIYSNNRWNYQQPFNQFTLSPSYKWIQTYIGYSSMSFSPYTLNGHQFLGGGVDLSPPGNFKVSVMAGRMQKRVLPDTANSSEFLLPAYYRFGSGVKGEYSFNGGSLSFSSFYAKDNKNSLSGYNDSLDVKPQENLCYSMAGNFSMIKNVNFSFEIGQSLITEDLFSDVRESMKTYVPGIKYRTSTHRYTAYKLNTGVNTYIGTVGLGYERIDPGYKTLGSYYSVNDFENFTFNYAGRAWKDKVTLALSTGLQRDDLDGTKQQQNKRIVGNANLGINPSQQFGLNFNYSNFSSYTHIKSVFDNINNTSPYGNLDTLSFTQLTESYGGALNYTPGKNEKVRHSIMSSANFQRASDKQSEMPANAGARFYNYMAGYNVSLTAINLSMGLTMNYNRNVDRNMVTEIFGPTVTGRKSFFKKVMNVTMGLSYNNSLTNGNGQGNVYVTRAGIGYSLKKKHNFDLNGISSLRNNTRTKEKHNELTITLTYRYNFSLLKEKAKDNNQKEHNEI